jgi:hypothetical protein
MKVRSTVPDRKTKVVSVITTMAAGNRTVLSYIWKRTEALSMIFVVLDP